LEASEEYLEYHLQDKGSLVFFQGKMKDDGSLPFIDQGLCLESSEADAPEDDESLEEEEEDDNFSDLEG
jgi:hypothetical protein